jgi:Zn-dependent protease with chaperone function
MLATSISLAILAIALAWPVPILLSRADWPSAAPATALLLWQAIALAGGLSMIGALITFGLIPFGPTLPSALVGLWQSLFTGPVESVDLVYLLALCAGVLLGGHLLLNLTRTIVLTERERRRHRELLHLLSSPVPNEPHTRMLDQSIPVAYCLPGTRHSITVYSAGLLGLLDEAELRAVFEHEKAHLVQRHYIVLMFFDAWRASLPWFPTATRAHTAVGMLVELLADDRARRVVDDRTLARAIALVSDGGESDAASPNADARARVVRLTSAGQPLRFAARGLVAATAVALVVVPTGILFAPAIGVWPGA